MYYLQSRYYDPEICRFINADKFATTGQGFLGHNMFAYCQNNPTKYIDNTGCFPVLAVTILAVFTIGGGVLGAMSEKKLSDTEPEKVQVPNVIEMHPNSISRTQQEKQESNTSDNASNAQLTTGDRIVNTLLGAAMGLAVGGAIVATLGAGASIIVGSATTAIPMLGATGLQTFAIGALAYDSIAITLAPFIGLEMEPIEIEP